MSIPMKVLLEDFSVEMTGKDIPGLEEAQPFLPAGTRVNVTFLGNESLEMRISAAGAVKAAGFVPVPHISARRIASEGALDEFLGALESVDASEHVFAVGGDPTEPEGPFAEAAALISSGAFEQHGVRTVSIGSYPEGHPDISELALWDALERKAEALGPLGLGGDLITQFSFDAAAVLTWIEDVRSRGIHLPIRIGVPGPAGVKRLLAFARRCGVGSSTSIAKKYGLSLMNLAGTAGPDRFITELAGDLEPDRHGVVHLHFYTFGGLKATAEWVQQFTLASRHSELAGAC